MSQMEAPDSYGTKAEQGPGRIPLSEREFIRHRLYREDRSSYRKYRELVVGEASFLEFLEYELVTSLLGSAPGALGIVLRGAFYPSLFAEAGSGAVFGRNIVVRNPNRIRLGKRVFLDDYCFLDARGAGEDGIVLEDDVIIGRGAYVQAKVGGIHIGSESVIGSGTVITSQGGVEIGEQVSVGAGSKISGGLFEIPRDERTRQRRYSRGPIRIGRRCILAGHAVVIDGVSIGEGAFVGAGAVAMNDLPPGSTLSARPAIALEPSSGSSTPETGGAEGVQSPASHADVPDPRTIRAIYAGLDIVNMQLPPDSRLPKSPDTPLHGEETALDSLKTVNLIVSVEEQIEAIYGTSIDLAGIGDTLVDRQALATVESLARYIDHLRRTDG